MNRFFLPICIQDYKNWSPLEGTVAGAVELYRVLNQYYNYELITKTFQGGSITMDQLWDAHAFLETIPADSQLIVYYSGHGYCAGRGEHAYWISSKGSHPKTGRRTDWFRSTDFIEKMADIQVRHALLINDTCLSGQLVRNCCGMPSPIDERPERTREILSSCDETEYVFDPREGTLSPFVSNLCALLKSNREKADCETLHVELKRRLKGIQHPLHIPLYNYGHEHGSFLFSSKKTRKSKVSAHVNVAFELPEERSITHRVQIKEDSSGHIGAEVHGGMPLESSLINKDFDKIFLASGERGTLNGLKVLQSKMPKELTLECGNDVHMELRLIPAGLFMMGGKGGSEWELPVHGVMISDPFYIGKYPVTQAQFEAVTGRNPSCFKGKKKHQTHPVETVSWEETKAFFSTLKKSNITELRKNNIVLAEITLPTEAQWEYACRAGSSGAYCFGNERAMLKGYAHYTGGAIKNPTMTSPVGRYRPNAWGLYDVHGNVREMCLDVLKSYPSHNVADPLVKCMTNIDFHILRGGSWRSHPRYCRSFCREHSHGWIRKYKRNDVGFRVCVNFVAQKV